MNTNFLNSLTNFLKKRTFEFIGLILISTSIGLAIAFTTYSPEDPSFVYGDREFEIKNFFDFVILKNIHEIFAIFIKV